MVRLHDKKRGYGKPYPYNRKGRADALPCSLYCANYAAMNKVLPCRSTSKSGFLPALLTARLKSETFVTG